MRELGRDGGVAWLAERLRRGDLERWRIELAAYCGDSEAAEVVDMRDETCCCGESYHGHTMEHMFVHACDYYGCLEAKGCLCPRLEPPLGFDLWLRGLERWQGALREAELACDVLCYGKELRQRWSAGPLNYAMDTGELHGEQRVREAIAARLIEWALG